MSEIRRANMPPPEELIAQLKAREEDLLIPGPPKTVCSNFVELVAGREVTPEEVAAAWVKAREIVMGNEMSLAKFLVGLHGSDVIKTLIPERDFANEAVKCLSAAISEASKRR